MNEFGGQPGFARGQIQHEVEHPLELNALRHAAAKQARQAVHRVIPAGAAAIHRYAHALGVEQGGLVHAQRQQLAQQVGGHLIPPLVLKPVGTVGFTRDIQRVPAAHAFGGQLRGFSSGAYQHAAVKEAVVQAAKEELAHFIGIDGQIIQDQVQQIIPVVAPVPFDKTCLGALL